jgi:membrane protein
MRRLDATKTSAPARRQGAASSLWAVIQETFVAWSDHEAPRLGASLSFYTILSLAPLIILVLALASLVFGHSTAQEQLIAQFRGMMGEDGAKAVQTVIEHGKEPTSITFASVVGVITLLFGASSVCGELQSALNKIWEVKTDGGSGFVSFIKARFFSFAMVLAVGFLLLVSLLVSTALASLGKFFAGLLPAPEIILHLLNFLVSFAGVSALFALIFKFVPAVKIRWADVWQGAIATAFLFTVGKLVIGLYLGKAAVGSAYGAAGSFIVVVVWVYYSAMIFFFGAEFTHVRANRYPSKNVNGAV